MERYLMKVIFALPLLFVLSLGSCSKNELPKKAIETPKESMEESQSGVEKPVSVISRGGKYDIEKNLVNGKVTVFKFYADW